MTPTNSRKYGMEQARAYLIGYVPIMVELEVELSPLKLRGSWVSTRCQTLRKSTRLWFWLSVIFFFKVQILPFGSMKVFTLFSILQAPTVKIFGVWKNNLVFWVWGIFWRVGAFEKLYCIICCVLNAAVRTQTRNDRLCSKVMHFCVKGMWYEIFWLVLSSTWHAQKEGPSIKELPPSDSLMGMPWRHFPDCKQVQGYTAFRG